MKRASRKPKQDALAPEAYRVFAEDLRLATDYWLKTIQPYIVRRRLAGAELYIASYAHELLRKVIDKAQQWNRTAEGARFPIESPDLDTDRFRQPEPLYADDLRAESLAALAVPLLSGRKAKSADEAVRTAHELLASAERYVANLPKCSVSAVHDFASLAFNNVTFGEIQKGNQENSGQLPFLPSLQLKRKGRDKKMITGAQSLDAIRKAVKRYLDRQTPKLTKEQYDTEVVQDQILVNAGRAVRLGEGASPTFEQWQADQKTAACMRNSRVPVLTLSQLRWERFKDFSCKQHRSARR